MERTDQELISAYLAGGEKSENALQILISRHLKRVYNFAYRLTGSQEEANDITQLTFLKAWKNLKKYDPEKKFVSWLLTITRNTAFDWLRTKKPVAFSDTEEDFEDTEPLPDEIFEKIEQYNLVQQALADLPLSYREIIIFHIHQELNFREIAEVTGKPLNTVKSTYRRGLTLLKKFLEVHQK